MVKHRVPHYSSDDPRYEQRDQSVPVRRVVVEPDHPAHDEPAGAADTSWGALTNMNGLLFSCASIEEIDPLLALERS